MARESRLEKHEKFILTALSEGKSYVQIAEGLAQKGCETSSVNVFKWVKRRAARILRAAQLVDPLAHAGHLVRTAPVQIQPVQTPAAAPTPEKSTPPAVPAAGAPNAVNPANPAASLKPKLGRDDVDLSAVDALIAAGESIEGGSQSKPGFVLGKK